jgi:hypothetical protein
MRWTVLIVLASLLVWTLPGCAPIEGRTVLYQGAVLQSPVPADQVQIVVNEAEASRYDPIAHLQYRTPGDNFDGSAERVLVERLRKEAAALGADALLDVTITVEEDGTETIVNEHRYSDLYPEDRDRRRGSTTTTARIKTGPSYRTVVTATAARRR